MLKDASKIKILGANFETATVLDLFDLHEGNKTKTTKGTLLYGRNGSGKSTIAKAFRKLTGEPMPSIISADLYDDANQAVCLNEEEQKQIFVFDEDYVDKNVRLQDNHLETIVMLGSAVDLSDEIEKAERELANEEATYQDQEKEHEQYLNTKSVKSPKYYIALLREALKGDDNWAGRDREIHDARQNTSVRDDTYKKFIKITPSKAKTELITDYKMKLKELEDAENETTAIIAKVPMIDEMYLNYDDQRIGQLLAEKIEKPELSDREKYLFELVEKGNSFELSERIETLRHLQTAQCPYCFQPLTLDYKAGLIESIEKVLNESVKEHQTSLKECISSSIDTNLQLYQTLDNYQDCVDLINQANLLIEGNNADLHRKMENPYEPITTNRAFLKDVIIRIVEALERLEVERIKYNRDAKKTAPIIADLERINSEIAHYDIKDLSGQLENFEDAELDMELWCQDIKSRAAVI